MKEEQLDIKDQTTALFAVTQLHGGVNYLLESKMKARIAFDDGVEIDLDLTEPILYVIGIELGATLEMIMNAKNRNELKTIPERVKTHLYMVLHGGKESEEGEEKKDEGV